MKLSPVEFRILNIIATDELAGREIAKRYATEAGSRLSYGTLYTTCRRLKENGLLRVRDSLDSDGRVRFFRATGNGIKTLDETRAEFAALANFGLNHAPA